MSDPIHDNAGEGRATPTLARHDIWSGLAFTLVGVAFAVESWRMPRLAERGIDPWTAPGVVPGFLGVILAFLGAVLLMRGLREWQRVGANAVRVQIFGSGDGRRRMFFTLALNIMYALVLIGRTPFWLATFGYLVAFMVLFGLDPPRGDAVKRSAIFVCVAALSTLVIVVLFQKLFLVRLP